MARALAVGAGAARWRCSPNGWPTRPKARSPAPASPSKAATRIWPLELARGRARDSAAGRTLAGPHRTDLAVTHLGKGQPAGLCSTGEQKALLLSIVLAHADLVAERAGRRPILLLDEVAAHLDPRRRAALFERLEAGGGQVWMTGTEAGLFDEIGPAASRFEVADGAVRPALSVMLNWFQHPAPSESPASAANPPWRRRCHPGP